MATPSDDRAEFNSQIPLGGNRHEAQATGATVIAGALLGVSPLALIKRRKKTPEAERERDDNTPEWDNPQTRTDGEAGDAGIDAPISRTTDFPNRSDTDFINERIRFEPELDRPHGLPEYTGGRIQGGNGTQGQVIVNGEAYYVQSGRAAPGTTLRDNPDIASNAHSFGHAEGHAAAILRETGARSAVITINKPSGPCTPCRGNLPSLLPEGGILTVRWPNQTGDFTTRNFVGKADIKK